MLNFFSKLISIIESLIVAVPFLASPTPTPEVVSVAVVENTTSPEQIVSSTSTPVSTSTSSTVTATPTPNLVNKLVQELKELQEQIASYTPEPTPLPEPDFCRNIPLAQPDVPTGMYRTPDGDCLNHPAETPLITSTPTSSPTPTPTVIPKAAPDLTPPSVTELKLYGMNDSKITFYVTNKASGIYRVELFAGEYNTKTANWTYAPFSKQLELRRENGSDILVVYGIKDLPVDQDGTRYLGVRFFNEQGTYQDVRVNLGFPGNNVSIETHPTKI